MSFKQKFNIHIEKIDNIDQNFEILDILGHGAMGPIYKARDKKNFNPSSSQDGIVLKCREKVNVKTRDFQREVLYSYLLSAHENIVNTYNIAYETPLEYIMVQEVAPFGTLIDWVPKKKGLEESPASRDIIRQVSSAIDFMHSKEVIHCDIRPENVLVFQHEDYKMIPISQSNIHSIYSPPNQIFTNYLSPLSQPITAGHNLNVNTTSNRSPSFSNISNAFTSLATIGTLSSSQQTPPFIQIIGQYRVKLAGFDKSLKRGSLIKKLSKANPYSAPEICDKFYQEGYPAEPYGDVWAFGVLVFYILTGNSPWNAAIELTDPDFTEFVKWLRRKRVSPPPSFKAFTDKFCKYFRKVFELKKEKRCPIKEINKYYSVNERWKKAEDDLAKVLPTPFKSDSDTEPIATKHRHNYQQRYHNRCKEHEDYDEYDDYEEYESNGDDSLRAQLEEFERYLEKKGVRTEMIDKKTDRKIRIESWLKSNPSDASLPNMGESSSDTEEIKTRVNNNQQTKDLSHPVLINLQRKTTEHQRLTASCDNLEDETASTTKPRVCFGKKRIPNNNKNLFPDRKLNSISPPDSRSPLVSPRISLDEGEGIILNQDLAKTKLVNHKNNFIGDASSESDEYFDFAINNDNVKYEKYDRPNSPVVNTGRTQPVSIYLEQASSESISEDNNK
ncbi:unnamed protein product [Gordionus sp. m RMFG-2023]|uniref:uncharacterized protein LOC135927485 n=1 Tax=Gordionus sp. m RMFG-2023 TaxID=3053472 RepID=UPI0030DE31F9